MNKVYSTYLQFHSLVQAHSYGFAFRPGGGGGGILGSIFAGYVPLASQNDYKMLKQATGTMILLVYVGSMW